MDNFFRGFESRFFAKNKILIRAYENIPDIFYLEKGFVRQYLISDEGEDLTLHVYKKGAFFPMAMILSTLPNKYFYDAATDTVVRTAPKEEVIDFIKTHPEVLFDLTKRLSRGLGGYLVKTEHLMLDDAHKKIISLLLYLTHHFGRERKYFTTIELPLTHKEISAWIGLTRETVSREIEMLKNKGFLSIKNKKMVIKNIKFLEKETEKYQTRTAAF